MAVVFPDLPGVAWVGVSSAVMSLADGRVPGGDVLGAWAESLGRGRGGSRGGRCLRFAFYGRVSTEDWQDPVTSRARQQQAVMLVAGHG
jgi:site-specific DNA recombinase